MDTRMERYGLDGYIGTGRGVKPGEAERRIELLAEAREDFKREKGYVGSLGDLYAWLREGEGAAPSGSA